MRFYFLLLFPICLFSAETIDDLFSLSLDELMEVEVTTVSKKQSNAFKSSSAVYIISQEQIRRSGSNSVPELLRLVPGLHVGRISSNQWAINARGTNEVISRELRIMIDGRDLHNSYSNGVFWDSVNVMLEDVERIEVVRGPGASLWGTNTAHGVINIITKKVIDTQGVLASVSIGDGQDAYVVSARLGFAHEHSPGHSRIYATIRDYDRSKVPDEGEDSLGSRVTGEETYDAHHMNQMGFVTEFSPDLESELRLSGDVYTGDSERESTSTWDTTDLTGANLMVGYDYNYDLYSHFEFKGYIDYFSRKDSDQSNKNRVVDLSFQHVYTRSNHSLVWGLEYNNILNEFTHTSGSFTLALDPQRRSDDLYSAFFQDDIGFFDGSFVVTPGLKYEHNNYTGNEYQPSLRGAYYPNEQVTLWGAVSRSVAAPSRLSVDGYLDLNDFPSFLCPIVGGSIDPKLGCTIPFNTGKEKENVINTYELGYRQQLAGNRLIMDHSVFYDKYIRKGTDGTNVDYLYGYEGNLKWAALSDWKLDLSYTYHYGQELTGSSSKALENLPKHTVAASSFYTLKEDTDFDVLYYFLDNTNQTSSYSRLDVRVEHRVNKHFSLSVVGQNLLQRGHIESTYDALEGNSQVERAYIGKITLVF